MRFFAVLALASALFTQSYILERVRSNDALLLEQLSAYHHKAVTPAKLNEVFGSRIRTANEAGFWFAKITITDFATFLRNDSTFLTFSAIYTQGQAVRLDSLRFLGAEKSADSLLLRETRLTLGDTLTPQGASAAARYLGHSNFASNTRAFGLVRSDSSAFDLEFEIDEVETSFINALVGFTPARGNADAEVTADIHLEFSNMAGTGRNMRFFWKKQSPRSSFIKLEYEEPWILGVPINQFASIQQTLHDSIYSENIFATRSSYQINENLSISAHFSYGKSIPVDSATSTQRQLPITESVGAGLELSYFGLDRRYNPRSGVRADLLVSKENHSRSRPTHLFDMFDLEKSYSSVLLKFDVDGYYRMFGNHILAVKSENFHVESSQIAENDYIYFGGHGSLRGFREKQFKTLQFAKQSIEYRLLLGENSRMYAFFDHAWYRNVVDNSVRELGGVGLGFRFQTGVGIVGIDYAFEADNIFNNGLLHIGLFGTID